MKLTAHQNKLETNVQSENNEFGIGDVSVVIDILRNRLYENKIQTSTQEIICNARDAHREIGKFDNKFNVTVPTHFSPVFKVRDFGPGISPDRMLNVFIKYGASTKRDTNNQTGGFGIGAKSFFSYTDSFAITTFINGIKRSYIAHIGVNNNGRLDLVSTEVTKEPNGTEIQVAVNTKDVEEFKNAILRAVYYWEEKPKLSGILNAPTLVHGTRVGDIEVIKKELIPYYASCDGHAIALIDGVPYPIGDKLLNRCPALNILNSSVKEQLIIYINNGIVEVSASRESIADSEKSITALKRIAEKGTQDLKTHISDAFAKAKETAEWITLYKELSRVFKMAAGYAKFKEYELHGDGDGIFIHSKLFNDIKATEIHCLGRYGDNRVEKVTKIEHFEEVIDPKNPPRHPKKALNGVALEYFSQLYYLNAKESVIVQNKRVRAHLFDQGQSKFFLLESIGGKQAALDKVVADLAVKPFDSITFEVVPKEERVKVSREKTEFCMHVLDRSRFAYTTLSDNIQKWLYVPITEAGGWEHENIEELKALNQYLSPLRVCGLAKRALNMVQNDANFVPLKDWLKEFKPSKEEVNYVKFLKGKNLDKLEILRDCKGIKEPLIVKLAKEYQAFLDKRLEFLPEILVAKTNALQEVKDFTELDCEVKQLIDSKYPLIKDINKYSSFRKELTFYINAKFEG